MNCKKCDGYGCIGDDGLNCSRCNGTGEEPE